jgi:hypothetical protein
MKLLTDLDSTRDETLSYYGLGDRELAATYGPGKWSVRYLLHHLADSETVLYDRIRRVISEPRQVIWGFDENAFAKGLDYAQVPLALSRDVFASVRNAIIHYAGRFYESHGHLDFVHSVTGVRTLREEFEKVVSHNAHHLAQVRAALAATTSTR